MTWCSVHAAAFELLMIYIKEGIVKNGVYQKPIIPAGKVPLIPSTAQSISQPTVQERQN